jgi:hypothetical protein
MTQEEALRQALKEARAFIEDDSPDWRVEKQRILQLIDAAMSEATAPPPYPNCSTPKLCAGKGYCPREISCFN